jgi:hypothetical protein
LLSFSCDAGTFSVVSGLSADSAVFNSDAADGVSGLSADSTVFDSDAADGVSVLS